MKNNIFGEEEPDPKNDSTKKESNPSKINEILDSLNILYKDKVLRELANTRDSQEVSKLAGTFIMELEVFFSTNQRF